MKSQVRGILLIICGCALIGGCGKPPAAREQAAGRQLTASDLAQLMDFHAWKIPVPPSLAPIKQVRLVTIKSDGTVIPKFETSITVGGLACSSILLGFRTEHGAFVGHLALRDPQGGGRWWNVNFTDPFADAFPAWASSGAIPQWHGNRIQLAVTTRNGDPMPSALELELVR